MDLESYRTHWLTSRRPPNPLAMDVDLLVHFRYAREKTYISTVFTLAGAYSSFWVMDVEPSIKTLLVVTSGNVSNGFAIRAIVKRLYIMNGPETRNP